MTKKRMETWQYVSQYQAQHGFGPTLTEIAQHFGISSLATAKKRVDALISAGYCERPLGKKMRLRVLFAPTVDDLRLDEALELAGPEGCVRWGNQVVQPECMFSREEVMRRGWEVVEKGESK